MNRRKSMTNTRHKNTNGPQKKYRLGTVSKNILLKGSNRFHGANLDLIVGRICAFYDKNMNLGSWLVDNKTKNKV